MPAALVTRFAPSPTGELHLGHAFAAMVAHEWARASGGIFRLRIDDLDHTRCRPQYEEGIYRDLAWLGLGWQGPVRRQSAHMNDYAAALETLKGQGLLYPCFCTRADIQAEVQAIAGAPQGPEGPLYPGACRGLSAQVAMARIADGARHAWRLDVARLPGGEALTRSIGDVVLGRKEMPASYHLAVVLDDAAQGITLVTRGQDLEAVTPLHMALQTVLCLRRPGYAHHRLITDERGQRLAKRDGARALSTLRAQGATPADVRRMLDWPAMQALITSRLEA
ncbi:MAG TPA: tRNA glutamyl-Q(34) synthetase GluQRS [Alphaproteobacteria bacterium]|nr:tRNA glutamyl-Q(34) synthetase GluQRS [Alphaproteobacteria bacterium]HAJ48123.1 tRNA glutamyl-Q(34) synthetase GluQRS [Alphaproteobacteria bacterium]